MNGYARKMMDARAAKRRAERRKESLQRQLSENTAKIYIIKKPRIE